MPTSPLNLSISPTEYAKGSRMAKKISQKAKTGSFIIRFLTVGLPILLIITLLVVVIGVTYKPEFFSFLPGKVQVLATQASFYLPLPKTKHQILSTAAIKSRYLRNYEQKFFVETFLQKPSTNEILPSFKGLRSDGAINLNNSQRPQLEQTISILSNVPGEPQYDLTIATTVIDGNLYFKIDTIPDAIRAKVDSRIQSGEWYKSEATNIGIYQKLRQLTFDQVLSSWLKILTISSYESLVEQIGQEQINDQLTYHFRMQNPGAKAAALFTDAYKAFINQNQPLGPEVNNQLRELAQNIQSFQFDTWIDARYGFPVRNAVTISFNSPVMLSQNLKIPLGEELSKTPLTKLNIGWDATDINEPFVFTPPKQSSPLTFSIDNSSSNDQSTDESRLDKAVLDQLHSIGTALEASYLVNGEKYPGGLNDLIRESFIKVLPQFFVDQTRVQYVSTGDKAAIFFKSPDTVSLQDQLWYYAIHDDAILILSTDEYKEFVSRFNQSPVLTQ
ncbi:hypothetical protein HGA91_06395 [candidate division WWE3 bacterium]|nr:hypothetical protein [candidate division WWE3 bacterium]